MSNVPVPTTHSASFETVVAFLERLGRALHLSGAPAHRLEEALESVAHHLGVEGQFFSTPTAIFASLRDGGPSHTILTRVEPGAIDLERLKRVEDVYAGLLSDDFDLHQASQRLEDVLARAPRYGAWLTVLSFALASGTAAQFFGGGWREMVAGGVLGLLVGALAVALGGRGDAGRLFEPLAGLSVATLAASAGRFGFPVSTYVVTLSALIILVPGLTLTVAMTELATKNLVAGSARFAGAMLTFLTIAFGVGLGFKLGSLFAGATSTVVPSPLPGWTEFLSLVVTAAALTVLFRAHPKELPWILAAAILGMQSARLGANLFGPEMGAFLGAVTIGIGSNLYGRWTGKPAALIQMPGLILLVPGSIGFRSLSSLMQSDVVSGIESAFTMILVAIALVTGLLISNVVVPPRHAVGAR